MVLKSLATNMGQGDENLDQDVILKFIQVCLLGITCFFNINFSFILKNKFVLISYIANFSTVPSSSLGKGLQNQGR